MCYATHLDLETIGCGLDAVYRGFRPSCRECLRSTSDRTLRRCRLVFRPFGLPLRGFRRPHDLLGASTAGALRCGAFPDAHRDTPSDRFRLAGPAARAALLLLALGMGNSMASGTRGCARTRSSRSQRTAPIQAFYRPRRRVDGLTTFPFEFITPTVLPSVAFKAALVAFASAPAMYAGFLWP